jgi:hypothetical protein
VTNNPTYPTHFACPQNLLFVLVAGLALSTAADAREAQAPKTGAALRHQLAAGTSVAWSDRPLAEGLASLSRSTDVAVFLDRRIDPTQPLTLTVRDVPLMQLLAELAAQAGGAMAQVGDVIYVGPTDAAAKLATVANLRRQEAARLPRDVRARLQRVEPWAWNELAQPRQLLEALSAEAGVTVAEEDRLPHDLWPAARLPPLAWTDRLSLLLAGFGLTFEIASDGRAVRLVPLPADVRLTKTYPPRGNPASIAAQLRRTFADAEVHIDQGRLIVTAAHDVHEQIERLLAGQPVRTTRTQPGQKVYSLTVENQPAGAVVRTLANQLAVELQYDQAVLETLQQKVSIKVQDAALDELLSKTLQPLGLTYRLDAKSLKILPLAEQP